MKIKLISIFLFLLWILNILLFMQSVVSNKIVLIVTVTSIIITIYSIYKIDEKKLSFSSVLLIYTIISSFGLIVPYLFLGNKILLSYSEYTLRFLNSTYLMKSIILGNIAILSFEMFKRLSRIHSKNNLESCMINKKDENKMYIVSSIVLIILVLYLGYYILFVDGFNIFRSYDFFRNSRLYNNSIYSYFLIMFYTSTIYLSASGKIKHRKFGWMLWTIIVLILMLTGNRGEFLYALLAVFGMKGLEGQKINYKIIGIVAILLFLIIPSIAILRNTGISNNLSKVNVSFLDSFTEMGMQIRTVVYTLEDLEQNNINYLYGESYYRPIINIIFPFNKSVATMYLKERYFGYGYSQVAESYLNFGLFGTILFFSIIGYTIGKLEKKSNNKIYLGYIGTITCILINATRNYFAFVPGQILIVTFIYLVIKNGSLKKGDYNER